jgi:hypothetical protein
MAMGSTAISYRVEARSVSKAALVFLGRVFFALTFLVLGAGHFAKPTIAYARHRACPWPRWRCRCLGYSQSSAA